MATITTNERNRYSNTLIEAMPNFTKLTIRTYVHVYKRKNKSARKRKRLHLNLKRRNPIISMLTIADHITLPATKPLEMQYIITIQ